MFHKHVKPGNVSSISDLEDISDSNLLDVDVVAGESVGERLSMHELVDNSVKDFSDSNAETVEGGV